MLLSEAWRPLANRGLFTYYVSQIKFFSSDPPSHQQWSAFCTLLLPPFVSNCQHLPSPLQRLTCYDMFDTFSRYSVTCCCFFKFLVTADKEKIEKRATKINRLTFLLSIQHLCPFSFLVLLQYARTGALSINSTPLTSGALCRKVTLQQINVKKYIHLIDFQLKPLQSTNLI